MSGERLIPCPTNKEVAVNCPCYPNCHLSRHHEVRQELLRRTRQDLSDGFVSKEYYQTVRSYIRHPMHIIVACRWIHEARLDPLAVAELPPEAEMVEWLERQNERTIES